MKINNGAEQIVYKNIMLGDVWFLSGQSNMQFPVSRFKDSEKWLKDANYENIRLSTVVTKYPPERPVWKECTPASAKDFSALGFLFGREIYKNKKVPIGLLCAAMDGSIISRWMSHESLMTIPYEAEKWEKYQQELPTCRERVKKYRAELARRKKMSPEAVKKLKKLKYEGFPYRPQSTLYNSEIKPIIPFPIKGVLWYQGESDGMFSMGGKYKTYLSALITGWRKEFACGNFPFIVVQLANYGGCIGWTDLRDAQLSAANKLPKTGMVVTIDIGEAKDIHPNNKLDVARRAALCARNIAYGENVVSNGPTYKSMKIDGNKITVEFNNTAGGVLVKTERKSGGTPKHFTIAGKNKRFYPAQAVIDGTTIIVWSDRVKNPVAVRYAWSQNPQGGLLFNKVGLPASPFRTDTWRLRTDWKE